MPAAIDSIPSVALSASSPVALSSRGKDLVALLCVQEGLRGLEEQHPTWRSQWQFVQVQAKAGKSSSFVPTLMLDGQSADALHQRYVDWYVAEQDDSKRHLVNKRIARRRLAQLESLVAGRLWLLAMRLGDEENHTLSELLTIENELKSYLKLLPDLPAQAPLRQLVERMWQTVNHRRQTLEAWQMPEASTQVATSSGISPSSALVSVPAQPTTTCSPPSWALFRQDLAVDLKRLQRVPTVSLTLRGVQPTDYYQRIQAFVERYDSRSRLNPKRMFHALFYSVTKRRRWLLLARSRHLLEQLLQDPPKGQPQLRARIQQIQKELDGLVQQTRQLKRTTPERQAVERLLSEVSRYHQLGVLDHYCSSSLPSTTVYRDQLTAQLDAWLNRLAQAHTTSLQSRLTVMMPGAALAVMAPPATVTANPAGPGEVVTAAEGGIDIELAVLKQAMATVPRTGHPLEALYLLEHYQAQAQEAYTRWQQESVLLDSIQPLFQAEVTFWTDAFAQLQGVVSIAQIEDKLNALEERRVRLIEALAQHFRGNSAGEVAGYRLTSEQRSRLYQMAYEASQAHYETTQAALKELSRRIDNGEFMQTLAPEMQTKLQDWLAKHPVVEANLEIQSLMVLMRNFHWRCATWIPVVLPVKIKYSRDLSALEAIQKTFKGMLNEKGLSLVHFHALSWMAHRLEQAVAARKAHFPEPSEAELLKWSRELLLDEAIVSLRQELEGRLARFAEKYEQFCRRSGDADLLSRYASFCSLRAKVQGDLSVLGDQPACGESPLVMTIIDYQYNPRAHQAAVKGLLDVKQVEEKILEDCYRHARALQGIDEADERAEQSDEAKKQSDARAEQAEEAKKQAEAELERIRAEFAAYKAEQEAKAAGQGGATTSPASETVSSQAGNRYAFLPATGVAEAAALPEQSSAAAPAVEQPVTDEVPDSVLRAAGVPGSAPAPSMV